MPSCFGPEATDGCRQVGIERGAGEDVAHGEHAAAGTDRQSPKQPAIVLVAELLSESDQVSFKELDARPKIRPVENGQGETHRVPLQRTPAHFEGFAGSRVAVAAGSRAREFGVIPNSTRKARMSARA